MDTLKEFAEVYGTDKITEELKPHLNEEAQKFLTPDAQPATYYTITGEDGVEIKYEARFLGVVQKAEETLEDACKRLGSAVNKAIELKLFEYPGPTPAFRLKLHTRPENLLYFIGMSRYSVEELKAHNSEVFPPLEVEESV